MKNPTIVIQVDRSDLDQQLYENFGYVNPQYLDHAEGLARVQMGQAVSDLDIAEANGNVLVISQFTLHASTKILCNR